MINDLASRILNIVSTLMLIVMVVSTIVFGVYVSKIVRGAGYNLNKQSRNIGYHHMNLDMVALPQVNNPLF